MIVAPSSRAPVSIARSLFCFVFVLVVTGAVVDAAAAPYDRRFRIVGLQNHAGGAYNPSRTLKQWDPRKVKPQPVRRAGRSRPSTWFGNSNNQGHDNAGHDGNNNDADGEDDDDDDTDDNRGDSNYEDGNSGNDDDATWKKKDS